jgi:hypothetical protein
MLVGFIGGGINSGDSIVMIATQPHLDAIDTIMKRHGISIYNLVKHGRYYRLDAQATLDRFMVNGWPDEEKFMDAMEDVMVHARGDGNHRVRAFGEMVALTWANGLHSATLELENLWNKFLQNNGMSLFCAYPHSGFTGKLHESIMHVCGEHAKIVRGSARPLTEILYKSISA